MSNQDANNGSPPGDRQPIDSPGDRLTVVALLPLKAHSARIPLRLC